MPLSHLVAAAKRNAPILKTSAVEANSETQVSQPSAAEGSEAAAEPRVELKKTMAEISEAEKTTPGRPLAAWQRCQYLKTVGEKEVCIQYMSLCAKEKCQKKFMEADFFDFKKYLKQGKMIK